MNFTNRLQKLPSIDYQTQNQIFHHIEYQDRFVYMGIILGGIITTFILLLLINKKKSEAESISGGIFMLWFFLIMLVELISFANSKFAHMEYKSQSYTNDHQSALNKLFPETNTKILTFTDRHNDGSGKSGITLYYSPDSKHEMAIATIVHKKYHALNTQGEQYKQLMDELFKITKGNKYSLLKISSTPTYNLKMQFIYQNKTYQLSFKNKQLITIKL